MFSRSANRDDCNNVYELNADGNVNNWNATNENRSAPTVQVKSCELTHSAKMLEKWTQRAEILGDSLNNT